MSTSGSTKCCWSDRFSTAASRTGTALTWLALKSINPAFLVGAAYVAPDYSKIIAGLELGSSVCYAAAVASGMTQQTRPVWSNDATTGSRKILHEPVPREESVIKALSAVVASAACHQLSGGTRDPLISCAAGSVLSSIITEAYMYARDNFGDRDSRD
jgi:hypothetical protein